MRRIIGFLSILLCLLPTLGLCAFNVYSPLSESPANEKVTLSGKVVDVKNEPLTGINVFVEGTTVGVATDLDGVFSLSVPYGEKVSLVFSFIGMKTVKKEFSCLKSVSDIKIVMEDDASELSEVIVTGIFKKNKDAYTGAVSVVTAKELKSFGNKNIVSSLANIDPSFNLISNNEWGSNPNKMPEIQIRGAANFSDLSDVQDASQAEMNLPLIIMDGFEITLQRLMDLDDSEVETITMLKDGSATAIYGSRGANGVIVITTKEPESGKLKLSYSGYLNIESPDLSAYHLLNARDKLQLEYLSGYYKNSIDPQDDLLLKQKYSRILSDVERGVDTYWLSKPLRTGIGHRHNLKLEGGDSSFRYALSLQYNNVAGVMKGSDRNSFNGGINLSYYHKDLIFRNNLQIGINKSIDSPYGSFGDYVKLNPYWTPYDEQGNLIKVFDADDGVWGGAYNWPKNPLYNATLNTKQQSEYTDITNNFSIEWKPITGLIVRGSVGVTLQNNNSDNFKPASHTDFESEVYKSGDGIFRKGRYAYTTGKQRSYNGSLTVSYSKLINDKHLFYWGLNGDISEAQADSYNFVVEGFVEESLDFLASALQYQQGGKPSGYESTSRRIGAVSNFNYSYDNKYYLDASFRVDGSSQFGTDKRFAPFYSVGLGWNIHNEKFMKNVSFVDRLKLRGSYGQTGSQKFYAYQAKAIYKYYLNDRYHQWMGAFQQALGNDNLSWQKTDKWNVGLETDVLNSRLRLVADVYLERTSNLLSSMNLPYSNGFTSYVENIGQLENKGFEVKATAFILRDTSKGLIWSVTGAIAHNKDKISKLSESMKKKYEETALNKSFNPASIVREGDSRNTIYAVPSLGIDPSTGKELFLTRTGDVTYTWNAADQVACGISVPKYRGTVSSMIRYKEFSANLSFGYRWGGQLYNSTLASRVENADKRYNVDERVYKNRWINISDRTQFKGINDETPTYATTRFVQNETTFTCQNINLSYDFKIGKSLQKYAKLQALSLSGNFSDLFYLSTVKQERGLDYPFSRRFSFTLNAIF